MSNTPLAHDLALKRTVHAPTEQKPIYAWRDVIANVEINLPPIVLLCPHGEERFDMAEVADTLGKALTNVCISQGEKDIFTDKNRAWVAQICRELAGNLTEMARKQNPLRLTLNALYELIEKTLVDNNAYMVAKSLLLNRSRKLSVSRESAAQSSVRVIRRNGQVVPGTTTRSRSPSGRPSFRSRGIRRRRSRSPRRCPTASMPQTRPLSGSRRSRTSSRRSS
jgi:ribonucleoside-diphosphate reductase alpha chain